MEAGIDLIVPYRHNRVNRPFENGRTLRRYCRKYKVERTNAWLKSSNAWRYAGIETGGVLKLWKWLWDAYNLRDVANRINNFRTRPIHKTT